MLSAVGTRIRPRPYAWGLAGLLVVSACGADAPSPSSAAAAVNDSSPSAPTKDVPSARPAPFVGQDAVTLAELFAAMREEAVAIAASPEIREEYRRLLGRHGMREDELSYPDYVRVKLAFEATRAGGLWGVAWTITDRQPQSDAVWAQWRALRLAGDALPEITATAECDELSALFAFVAHGLGVSKRSRLGLFWPTANHTVAVWVVERRTGEARIVVPTSQIFLDQAQTLDTRAFDPSRQKNIYDYRRADVSMATTLPAGLARGFILALRRDGGRAEAELQRIRNLRERRQWAQLQRASRR